ncbi:MAG: thioredoxin-dependent thiol peroxidase [Solirubrobacterales bacterium]|nr:thioredoxin-dependent thiol peroxidase [Solirubrobacterales bacterium]
MRMLETGAQAPDFTLSDQDGNDVSLTALTGAGKTVVVYFYPKADTPGCTTQACSVRDHAEEYAAANAVVLGVSPDPVAKVKKFHAKHDMNFTLLADEDHAVSEQFGVWAEKSMYGKTYMGNLRATFIIAPTGEITHVFPKVSPKTHDDVVLTALGGTALDG